MKLFCLPLTYYSLMSSSSISCVSDSTLDEERVPQVYLYHGTCLNSEPSPHSPCCSILEITIHSYAFERCHSKFQIGRIESNVISIFQMVDCWNFGGLRNLQITVISLTCTVSELSRCDLLSCFQLFSIWYFIHEFEKNVLWFGANSICRASYRQYTYELPSDLLSLFTRRI